MQAHQGSSAGGRWVPTFATDIEPGDKIRRGGVERFVVARDYPSRHQPTYRVEYTTGGESIGKLAIVSIWDPDGSVSQRVQDISAAAIR
ncbi:hypothetical protein OG417_45300 [Actinoallomurus sp. NBC_01490]|uniref:hypothetical protein n=1 Tax=Actinoallomurus sp. NBC_01490 TaxID=2903557 RepID=UPI002E34694E|nr:hypothetical protein [Actinoallomurus sp. NBC_01490]